MPGSNKPRPARPGHARSGRPPDNVRFAPTEPSHYDLVPDASTIFVEGRATIEVWTPKLRTAWSRLVASAEALGLVAHEVAPTKGDNLRRSWNYQRLSLNEAWGAISDGKDGLFDDFVKHYLFGKEPSEVRLAAARKTATVAVSKLAKAGRVEKFYDPEDGRLRLRAVKGRQFG